MEVQNDTKLHNLKIVSDVLICLGTVVILLSLRFVSSWVIKKCLLLDSNVSDGNSSSDTFVRNLCEIPIVSWLYPIGTVISLILLMSPEMKFNPLLVWHDWADIISCIHTGHLFTQMIVSAFSWTRGIHLKFRIQFLHYFTACSINIICLSTRQMATIVLLGIIAQLPILFAIVNSIISKSLCPCFWTSNWLLWVITQIGCCFIVPGFFLLKPLVAFHGIPQGLSTPATIALYWAISYFGILFLWELYKPLKALFRECKNDQLYNSEDVSHQPIPIFCTERTPLVSAERLAEVKNQISVP